MWLDHLFGPSEPPPPSAPPPRRLSPRERLRQAQEAHAAAHAKQERETTLLDAERRYHTIQIEANELLKSDFLALLPRPFQPDKTSRLAELEEQLGTAQNAVILAQDAIRAYSSDDAEALSVEKATAELAEAVQGVLISEVLPSLGAEALAVETRLAKLGAAIAAIRADAIHRGWHHVAAACDRAAMRPRPTNDLAYAQRQREQRQKQTTACEAVKRDFAKTADRIMGDADYQVVLPR